jgi:hypothetical protein
VASQARPLLQQLEAACTKTNDGVGWLKADIPRLEKRVTELERARAKQQTCVTKYDELASEARRREKEVAGLCDACLLLGVHLLQFGDTLLKTGSIGLQPGNPIIGLCASSFNLLEEQTCLKSQGGSLAGGWKISLRRVTNALRWPIRAWRSVGGEPLYPSS